MLWLILEKAAVAYPEKVGVVDGDRRLTYAEVGARTRALARFFRGRGVRPGDRISILALNCHQYLEVYFAAAGIGAILNPLNTRLSAQEIGFILRDAGSRWLVTESRFAPLVEEALLDVAPPVEGLLWLDEVPAPVAGVRAEEYEAALAEVGGPFEPASVGLDDVAHLYYTSGTTGEPKGVMLTHGNVGIHALATIAELRFRDADVWGHVAPMFHLADAWATFALTWVGGRHVMLPRFEAGAALALVERERVTVSNLIPTMLNLMVNHPEVWRFDLASLRLILSGGAPIAPELVRRIIATFGCDYVNTYGMTETSPYLTLSLLKEPLRRLPPEEQLAYKAKTGRPFIAVTLKVVDEADQPVAADERQVGEIRVRGATVTPGYWQRPEETERAFWNGWLCTGDLAVVDAEGYVTIVDRKKDMICTGGENVYSTEVEHALYAHPKVLEAAVFGVPDEKWGEAVKAAVVLKPGDTATEAELIAFCKQRLSGYKAPKSIDFLGELPRTGSGKITKRALRDPYWEQAARRV